MKGNVHTSLHVFSRNSQHITRIVFIYPANGSVIWFYFPGNDSKKLKVPAALKKVCQDIFSTFSEYHLGKYCTESARKREIIKAKKRAKPEAAASDKTEEDKMAEDNI